MKASLKFTEKTENEATTKMRLIPFLPSPTSDSSQPNNIQARTWVRIADRRTEDNLHHKWKVTWWANLYRSTATLKMFLRTFPWESSKTCSCYHLSWWDRQAKRTKLVPFNPNLRFSHGTYSPVYQYFLKPVPMPWGLSWFERETSSIGSYIWRLGLQ